MNDHSEKILNELKNANSFELKQLDSFTEQARLLFIIASVITGTSFLTIENLNLFIIIIKVLIFTIVLLAIYFTMPYLRFRKYKIYPEINCLKQWLKKENSDRDFNEWLIKIYGDNVLHNENQNLKRENDFKKSSYLLLTSAVILFFLFGYYFLLKPDDKNKINIAMEEQLIFNDTCNAPQNLDR